MGGIPFFKLKINLKRNLNIILFCFIKNLDFSVVRYFVGYISSAQLKMKKDSHDVSTKLIPMALYTLA